MKVSLKKLLYVLPAVVVLTACGSSRKTAAESSPTVKRTKHSSPRFIDGISVTPGEEGPGADGSPNTGRLSPRGSGVGVGGNIENASALQFKYAIRIGAEVEALTNLALLQFIDDWYGTRYRYGGTTKSGVDCSGFVCALSSDVYGRALPRTSREQFDRAQKIGRDYLQEGDLVFFNTRGGVSHVGIYLGNNKFVHASTSSGVVISDLDEEYYRRRFVGAGRL